MPNGWEEKMTAYLANRLRKSVVFDAVGDDLREAMIAREVMELLCGYADDFPSTRIEPFDRLFRMLCAELLPQVRRRRTAEDS
jgi:hypothetical protein